LPEPAPAVLAPEAAEPPAPPRIHCVLVRDSFWTVFNWFGIACDYLHQLSYDPDCFLSGEQFSNIVNHFVPGHKAQSNMPPDGDEKPPPWPWSNMTTWYIMNWMWSGSSQKSGAEVTHLVKQVILAEDFDPEDLVRFNVAQETSWLDAVLHPLQETASFFQRSRWKETSVEVLVLTQYKSP
ncbi:hypothetical protein PAXRUDRAFT_159523, partial [Paxillus rubicundulus Ve08.2h10]